ncbi:YigZ family protein [Fluviispira sanaruensis]|uniref:YigZ family protein n=1 Tax=Fluviispira sanaruensis TaxID=2493639 RepID=A0A4P2VPQ5_FLUSA|nr:YigZ family protein [Fluviispira sanaruensis]BBH53819.1 YigZ family protein [Fluviispira sanaruensis]
MSVVNFKTIYTNVVAEKIIEKSKFITSLEKVKTEEQAFHFFSSTRKKYFDATHNCTAFVLNSGSMRSNDDGEPAGTAGKPMLEFLKKNEIFNIAVVVTRYFGGVKLGTGGLIRAYSACVSEAVQKAGIVENILHYSFCVTFAYSQWKKIENYLNLNLIYFDKPIFSENIQIKIYVKNKHNFINNINDICNGSVIIEAQDDKFIEVLLPKQIE